MIRKIIKALWILLAIAVVAVVIIFVSISKRLDRLYASSGGTGESKL